MGLWPPAGRPLTVPCVVASFPPLVAPASVQRRAFAVLGVAGLAVASMAVGLGLAFPGGIGSRSGSGAGVSPIYVTPARSQARPAISTGAVPAPNASLPAQHGSTGSSPTIIITPPTPGPATTPTTTPSDVVNQVNQQVTDVLDGLVPSQSAAH